MSNKEDKPKKGGLVKKLMLPLVAVALLGGGGAVAGYFVAGSMGGHEAGEDPDAPKVVLKDGTHVSAHEAGLAKDKTAHGKTTRFTVTYHPIEQPFTANLRNDSGFAQFSLAVSTVYDEKVVAALTEHEVAIRSAVLMAVSENDAMDLETLAGKQHLREEIRDVINKTLEEKTGYGGIDDVYFTALVIQ